MAYKLTAFALRSCPRLQRKQTNTKHYYNALFPKNITKQNDLNCVKIHVLICRSIKMLRFGKNVVAYSFGGRPGRFFRKPFSSAKSITSKEKYQGII